MTIDDIKDFHLDSAPSVTLLETLEINHSAWSKPLRYVTNHADGITAKLENDTEVFFEFAHIVVKRGNTSDDLDQSIDITVGDLGEVVPPLIELIRESESEVMPTLVYRAYAYDAKTMQLVNDKPIDIVKGLFIEKMNRDYQATTFQAITKSKNTVTTGMTYNFQDFPDLKGYL